MDNKDYKKFYLIREDVLPESVDSLIYLEVLFINIEKRYFQ
ncbi:UPF0735 ACT domain-containing protein [Staphylococcus aureus M0409]|nr:UPF0735 ACT domain-containing protein [Staphylococcus aureus M0409]